MGVGLLKCDRSVSLTLLHGACTVHLYVGSLGQGQFLQNPVPRQQFFLDTVPIGNTVVYQQLFSTILARKKPLSGAMIKRLQPVLVGAFVRVREASPTLLRRLLHRCAAVRLPAQS